MLPIELFLLLLQDVPLFQEVLFAFRVDRRLEVRELGAGDASTAEILSLDTSVECDARETNRTPYFAGESK